MLVLVLGIFFAQTANHPVRGNRDAERLFSHLMKDYNKYVRPVEFIHEALQVRMELQFIQLIGVHEVNQVITTNVILKQFWKDYKLTWDPAAFGGIKSMKIPSSEVWVPDIVLYNTAEGDYQITRMTKLTVTHNGSVKWEPPAIYRSYCQINVRYFPYDKQTCMMNFSSWSYDERLVNVIPSSGFVLDNEPIEVGMDLSEYKESIEWDILEASSVRNRENWPYGPWVLIKYKLVIKRKALFYTVNLVIPCVLISLLTIFVFYLPCDSGEKVTLCISILLSLTVFILLLAAILPQTSENVPLLGRYLLFTLIMTCMSIALTVVVINVHFRNPATHKMSMCTRKVLLDWLPKLLLIQRPVNPHESYYEAYGLSNGRIEENTMTHRFPDEEEELFHRSSRPRHDGLRINKEVQKALDGIDFIMHHVRHGAQYTETVRDWKFAAFVLDRLFLIVFGIACLLGTSFIILDAPPLYENVSPIPKNCTIYPDTSKWFCLANNSKINQ